LYSSPLVRELGAAEMRKSGGRPPITFCDLHDVPKIRMAGGSAGGQVRNWWHCPMCRKESKRRTRDRHGARWASEARLKKFGLSEGEYETLLSRQNGRCARCKKRKPLHIDHSHVTGRVRGLLCMRCNTAIGALGDEPDALRAVVAYLEGGDTDDWMWAA
jgi:hypothetical protein